MKGSQKLNELRRFTKTERQSFLASNFENSNRFKSLNRVSVYPSEYREPKPTLGLGPIVSWEAQLNWITTQLNCITTPSFSTTWNLNLFMVVKNFSLIEVEVMGNDS